MSWTIWLFSFFKIAICACYYIDLDSLTDEQLSQMQGTSRQAIISRLKQIQKLEGQLRMIGDQLHQIADFFPPDADFIGETDDKGKRRADQEE